MDHNDNNIRFADIESDLVPPAEVKPFLTQGEARPLLEIDGFEVEPEPETEPTKIGPTVAALRNAGLSFPVALAQPELPEYPMSPNLHLHRYCVRSDTGHIFGPVSPGYGFCQPEELAATIDAALPEGAGQVMVRSTAFGDRIWFEVEMPMERAVEICPDMDSDTASMNQRGITQWRSGNTPLSFRLLAHHAYGGKGTLELSLLVEAIICGNGLRVTLKDGKREIKIRHTRYFEERVEMLRYAFEKAGSIIDLHVFALESMAQTRIGAVAFDHFCKTLFPNKSTQEKNRRARFEDIYQSAIGAAPGTAWGALQAATYYASHEFPVRVRGRSLRRYTLEPEQSLSGVQLDAIAGQARLESMVSGEAGAFTERAYQYVTQHMLELA